MVISRLSFCLTVVLVSASNTLGNVIPSSSSTIVSSFEVDGCDCIGKPDNAGSDATDCSNDFVETCQCNGEMVVSWQTCKPSVEDWVGIYECDDDEGEEPTKAVGTAPLASVWACDSGKCLSEENGLYHGKVTFPATSNISTCKCLMVALNRAAMDGPGSVVGVGNAFVVRDESCPKPLPQPKQVIVPESLGQTTIWEEEKDCYCVGRPSITEDDSGVEPTCLNNNIETCVCESDKSVSFQWQSCEPRAGDWIGIYTCETASSTQLSEFVPLIRLPTDAVNSCGGGNCNVQYSGVVSSLDLGDGSPDLPTCTCLIGALNRESLTRQLSPDLVTLGKQFMIYDEGSCTRPWSGVGLETYLQAQGLPLSHRGKSDSFVPKVNLEANGAVDGQPASGAIMYAWLLASMLSVFISICCM